MEEKKQNKKQDKKQDKDLELKDKKIEEEQMGEVAGGITNKYGLPIEEIPKIIYPDAH